MILVKALEDAGCGILVTGPDIDPPGPVIWFANAAMSELTGYTTDELVGATPRILQGPLTQRAMLDHLREELSHGRSVSDEAINYRKDGSTYVVDWQINPVFDRQGAIEAWVAVQRDVSRRRNNRLAQRDNEERLRVLVAELQHRTRNLMGVVRSMTDKTLRASADLQDFGRRIGSRFEALARVQGLLSQLESGDRLTLDELIRSEISILSDEAGPVTFDGPTGVELRSHTVQTLAMALHELMTNAQKYGALGQPGARLDIRWTLERMAGEEEPWLRIDWRESGVAMPSPDTMAGAGQGRALIERALPYQLGAKTSYVLGADGLRCVILIPVSAASAGDG